MKSISKIIGPIILCVLFATNLYAIAQNELDKESKLLAYTADRERELITLHAEDPHIDTVVEMILAGEWEKLFKNYGFEKIIGHEDYYRLSFIVINAYKQRKISLDDLATCFMFHRTYANFPRLARIHRLQDMPASITTHREELETIAPALPSHQRYVLTLHTSAFDDWTRTVIHGSFCQQGKEIPVGMLMRVEHDQGIYKIDILEEYGIASFGLINADGLLNPVIHHTPSTEEMAHNVSLGCNDFALLFPHERKLTHGSKDASFWVHLHDMLHKQGRKKRLSENKELYLETLALFKHHPNTQEIQDRYESKLDDGHNKLRPSFKWGSFPDEEEQLAYLFDRLYGEVVDGGVPFDEIAYTTYCKPQVRPGYITDYTRLRAEAKIKVSEVTPRDYLNFLINEITAAFKAEIKNSHNSHWANQITEQSLKNKLLERLFPE